MEVDHLSIYVEACRCSTKNPRGSGQRSLRMNAGYLSPQKKTRKNREADDQIKRVVMKFIGSQAQSMIDFFRGVSHNFEIDP